MPGRARWLSRCCAPRWYPPALGTAILAGVQHSQLCGLLFGGVRHILAAAHNHRMTAGGFLYMEPDILAAGSVQGQLIVLQVVAPDQNFKAIAGAVAQEIRRFLFAFPLLIVFQVALAFQLGAHFVQGLLAGAVSTSYRTLARYSISSSPSSSSFFSIWPAVCFFL